MLDRFIIYERDGKLISERQYLSSESVGIKNLNRIRAIIREKYKKLVKESTIKSFVKLDMNEDSIVEFICQAFTDASECQSCPFITQYNCEKHLREFLNSYQCDSEKMESIETLFL